MTRRIAHVLILSSLSVLRLVLFSPMLALARAPATIVRVVDGDTLEITLKGKTEKVRLIGVE